MPQRNQVTVRRVRDVLDNRSGHRIGAEWGHVAVVEGGGHICELNLNRVAGVNPLWKPPWNTIDPDRYGVGRHRRVYGPNPDGKLLAGIAGHSLSFDHFGPPSEEEVRAGLSTHGEAPVAKWTAVKSPGLRAYRLAYGCTLGQARMEFRRTLALDPTSPVVYCEEQATNLSCYDRLISWTEHVTIGPPFLECGTTICDMPATRAKVCPASFSRRMFLQPEREFIWPMAPGIDGSPHDLRRVPAECYGHYTAQLLDPALDITFISACNPRQGLLVVWAFRRRDFPWVGNWEERHHRNTAPWNGKTFCRGLEFSTTPFAIPRRETVDQGPLFGERTYRWLPAHCTVRCRFLILLFAVPESFAGVQGFSLERGFARVFEAGAGRRQLTVKVRDFLAPPHPETSVDEARL